jgi:hypothetical protein
MAPCLITRGHAGGFHGLGDIIYATQIELDRAARTIEFDHPANFIEAT